MVSSRCVVVGSVHVLYPTGHTPGLKYMLYRHPSGQQSSPYGPAHPWTRSALPYMSSVCGVAQDAGGVNVVVSGPAFFLVVSMRLA